MSGANGHRRLTGAQVLLLTPFDEDGEVDERSLAALLEYVIGAGIDGIVGGGTTGECFTLSVDEQARLMSLIAEQVRGRVPLTFGIGNSATSVSIELARHAQELGADCVMLQPPYYFQHAPEAIDAHFLAVANAIDVPLMVYDGGAGIELSVERVRSLNERAANIRYVKMSIPDPAKVGAMRAARTVVEPLAGDELMMLMGMRHGAIGSTVGWGNVDPEAIAGIHRAFEAGDLPTARRLQLGTVVPAVGVCITAKSAYIRCYKEILAAKGVIASPTTRLPLMPLDEIRRDEVLSVMRELSVLLRGAIAVPEPALVLLDLDGVLVDSRDAMETAWRAVQHDVGVSTPFDAYFREIGRPFRDILERLELSDRADEIERVFRATALREAPRVPAFPGIHTALARLDKRGVKLGVVTSKARSQTAWTLAQFDVEFATVQTPERGARQAGALPAAGRRERGGRRRERERVRRRHGRRLARARAPPGCVSCTPAGATAHGRRAPSSCARPRELGDVGLRRRSPRSGLPAGLDRVADAHAPRLEHARMDAERQRLGRLDGAIAAVGCRWWSVGKSTTPVSAWRVVTTQRPTLPRHAQQRLAEAQLAAAPAVLCVRRDAVDPERHAEAARVDLLAGAALLAQPLERGPRQQRDGAVAAAIDARALGRRGDEPQRRAGVLGQRRRERAGDWAGTQAQPEEAHVGGLPQLDRPGDLTAVGKAQSQAPGGGVVVGEHAHERADPLRVHHRPGRVDEEERAVARDPVGGQLGLLQLAHAQPLHGRGGDPRDACRHVRHASHGAGVCHGAGTPRAGSATVSV